MIDPDWVMYAKTVLALIFVIGLIFLVAFVAKKAGLDQKMGVTSGSKRTLSVVETLYIDPRHRLVLVRSGEREHLILVGAAGDLLIESRERDVA